MFGYVATVFIVLLVVYCVLVVCGLLVVAGCFLFGLLWCIGGFGF